MLHSDNYIVIVYIIKYMCKAFTILRLYIVAHKLRFTWLCLTRILESKIDIHTVRKTYCFRMLHMGVLKHVVCTYV